MNVIQWKFLKTYRHDPELVGYIHFFEFFAE